MISPPFLHAPSLLSAGMTGSESPLSIPLISIPNGKVPHQIQTMILELSSLCCLYQAVWGAYLGSGLPESRKSKRCSDQTNGLYRLDPAPIKSKGIFLWIWMDAGSKRGDFSSLQSEVHWIPLSVVPGWLQISILVTITDFRELFARLRMFTLVTWPNFKLGNESLPIN